MSGNNNTVGVNDYRLPEAELFQTGCNSVNRVVIDSRVSVVGFDAAYVPQFDRKGL
ncbi:hypothetical protein FACS1894170_09570 [Planctomycetales bacterium]|nr:hypothetical protein FACS1894170_09570 [Planctomycetales bacterium]